MKKLITAILLITSSTAYTAVDYKWQCDHISWIRAWSLGSDRYGLRLEHRTPMQGCEGGFYFPHDGANKSLSYGTAMAGYVAKQQVCVLESS